MSVSLLLSLVHPVESPAWGEDYVEFELNIGHISDRISLVTAKL